MTDPEITLIRYRMDRSREKLLHKGATVEEYYLDDRHKYL